MTKEKNEEIETEIEEEICEHHIHAEIPNPPTGNSLKVNIGVSGVEVHLDSTEEPLDVMIQVVDYFIKRYGDKIEMSKMRTSYIR